MGVNNMSRGMPSMTALLGLLALAGYQNRDKLAELLNGAGGNKTQPEVGKQQDQPLGNLLGHLSGVLAGGGVGSLLSGGLSELLERFKANGQGDAANSWVGKVKPGASCAASEAGYRCAIKTGQTHVQAYTRPLLKLIEESKIDPSFVLTHPASLEEAPAMYRKFRDKEDSVIKVVLRPGR